MSRRIRSFVAIELSSDAKAEITRVVEHLKDADAAVKWAHPQTVHLTLKFLGDVPEEKLEQVSEKLRSAVKNVSPFDFVLGETGVFPDWYRPRVLWVGTADGNEEVKALAAKVEKALFDEGFAEEKRPFSPHLTVGRIKSGKNIAKLSEEARSITVKPVKTRVSQIVLFSSDITPEGAVHTPINTFHLGI